MERVSTADSWAANAMAKRRNLAGVAHDIAHHARSGVSYLCPHMAQALRGAGRDTTVVDLLDPSPYPEGTSEVRPLRLALQALHATAGTLLAKYGFTPADVSTIHLHATPPLWDAAGSSLHCRVVIVTPDGQSFDSGWLQ